jgi:hypothetical protein
LYVPSVQPAGFKSAAWQTSLALLISSVPLTILVAGLLGKTSNSVVTAALLFGPIVGLLCSSRWSNFRLNEVDAFFVVFVTTAIASMMANGLPPLKSLAMFALSLAAYPACRFGSERREPSSFLWITSAIVLVGTIASAVALITQWNDPHGKPLIFGMFDHGGAVFLSSLAFLIIFLVVEKDLSAKKAIIVSAAITIPIVVFAASQVRFTFAALGFVLLLSSLIVRKTQRSQVRIVIAALVLSVFVGIISRHNDITTQLLQEIGVAVLEKKPARIPAGSASSAGANTADPATISYTVAAHQIKTVLEHLGPTSAECEEADNSISMRRTLMKESFYVLPEVGPFGIGLSAFAGISCLTRDPHNSILQAAIEFGFVGGLSLVLIILSVIRGLWVIPKNRPEVDFVLCSFVFVTIEDMAHGHLIYEMLFFAFAGYGSQLIGQMRKVRNSSQRDLEIRDAL